jgi:hypothetical protein
MQKYKFSGEKLALGQQRLSDDELVKIFPEAKEIIPAKLKEFSRQRKALISIISDHLAVINKEPDEMFRWFWQRWLQLNEGEDLLVVDRHIARLRRQLRVVKGLPAPKGALTDDVIQAAREVPVEDVLAREFKRAGSTLLGLCPFHEDHKPSFHIYPKENRGWCFVCNQGSDAIGIAMQVHGCGFKEAVLLLTGGQL